MPYLRHVKGLPEPKLEDYLAGENIMVMLSKADGIAMAKQLQSQVKSFGMFDIADIWYRPEHHFCGYEGPDVGITVYYRDHKNFRWKFERWLSLDETRGMLEQMDLPFVPQAEAGKLTPEQQMEWDRLTTRQPTKPKEA